MAKIVFMGAGSTVFARNVIGDCMCREALNDSEFVLYDIDAERLKESAAYLSAPAESFVHPVLLAYFRQCSRLR